MMRDIGSVVRGIQAMSKPYPDPQPGWVLKRVWGFWAEWWTPVWHKGRGPYISIGLGFFAIYRGY